MQKTTFIVIFVALFWSLGAHAAETSMMTEIKKTLSFIFLPNSSGAPIPNGTAFFVGVKSEKHGERFYVYLVTAKHVLMKDPSSFHDSVLVRLNKKDGSSELLPVPLVGPNAPQLFTHSDQTVDIAALPLAPNGEHFDTKWIPDSMLVTKETFEKLRIKEGDDVFFGGLFVPFPGAKKNIPIIRFGKVAMISDEKIPWDSQMLDLYLMETQSFGGNSGSPVFFNLNPTRDPGMIVIGAPQVFVAGVMKGSFLNANEVMVINRAAVPISRENAGIAAVVPSYLLHELLFGSAATALRKKADEQ